MCFHSVQQKLAQHCKSTILPFKKIVSCDPVDSRKQVLLNMLWPVGTQQVPRRVHADLQEGATLLSSVDWSVYKCPFPFVSAFS